MRRAESHNQRKRGHIRRSSSGVFFFYRSVPHFTDKRKSSLVSCVKICAKQCDLRVEFRVWFYKYFRNSVLHPFCVLERKSRWCGVLVGVFPWCIRRGIGLRYFPPLCSKRQQPRHAKPTVVAVFVCALYVCAGPPSGAPSVCVSVCSPRVIIGYTRRRRVRIKSKTTTTARARERRNQSRSAIATGAASASE